MTKLWQSAPQQCKYNQHYWAVHLKMVTIINFTLCFLSQFFKATRHKQVSDIHEVMKSEFIVLKYGQDSEKKKGGKSR